MLLIAIPVGLLIGVSLGALGGGGSILTVPALVYLLNQSPHAATTGSLLIVGITAIAGTVAHLRAGRVRVAQGLTFGVLGVAGSWAGSGLSAHVNPNVLLTAFAILMLVAAAAMSRRAHSGPDVTHQRRDEAVRQQRAARPGPTIAMPWRARTAVLYPSTAQPTCNLTSPSQRVDACRAIRVVLAASVVGLLTGFFGVGGGFVIVPALVLALGFDMPVAVGTSLLVISVNSVSALAARLGTHVHLDWRLLATFTAAAIAGSFVGNRVASRVDAVKLTVAFTGLLVLVAGYTAARSLPHLI